MAVGQIQASKQSMTLVSFTCKGSFKDSVQMKRKAQESKNLSITIMKTDGSSRQLQNPPNSFYSLSVSPTCIRNMLCWLWFGAKLDSLSASNEHLTSPM